MHSIRFSFRKSHPKIRKTLSFLNDSSSIQSNPYSYLLNQSTFPIELKVKFQLIPEISHKNEFFQKKLTAQRRRRKNNVEKWLFRFPFKRKKEGTTRGTRMGKSHQIGIWNRIQVTSILRRYLRWRIPFHLSIDRVTRIRNSLLSLKWLLFRTAIISRNYSYQDKTILIDLSNQSK